MIFFMVLFKNYLILKFFKRFLSVLKFYEIAFDIWKEMKNFSFYLKNDLVFSLISYKNQIKERFHKK